jgi:hypothetical protein
MNSDRNDLPKENWELNELLGYRGPTSEATDAARHAETAPGIYFCLVFVHAGADASGERRVLLVEKLAPDASHSLWPVLSAAAAAGLVPGDMCISCDPASGAAARALYLYRSDGRWADADTAERFARELHAATGRDARREFPWPRVAGDRSAELE